jgi:hypothetical protein
MMIEQTREEMAKIGDLLNAKRTRFGELWNKFTQGHL